MCTSDDQEGVPRGCLLRVIYMSRSPTPPLEAAAVTLFGLTLPKGSVPWSGLRAGREDCCPQSHQLCWLNPRACRELAAELHAQRRRQRHTDTQSPTILAWGWETLAHGALEGIPEAGGRKKRSFV